MNRRISQREDDPRLISEDGSFLTEAAKTILWGIMAGIGMGLGYFIVKKSVKKVGLE